MVWVKVLQITASTVKKKKATIGFQLALILHLTCGVGGLTDLSGLLDLHGVHVPGTFAGGGGGASRSSSDASGASPRWRLQPPNWATFSNSSGLRLECVATGDPPPTVEWFQEDQLITHNLHGLRVVMPNGSLVFPRFKGDHFREDLHTASYRCRARNRLGTILSRLVKVNAVVDEDYTVAVQDVHVIRGNTAVLRCDIPANIRDHVRVTSWLHEEGTAIEIYPERDPRGKYTLLQTGDLLVHHTSTYDTYKKYVCKTEHKLTGLRRRSIQPARLILKEPEGTAVVPKLTEPPSQSRVDRHMLQGEHILMPCVAEGYPVPESTWFRIEGVGLRQVLPSPKIKHHLEVLIIHELHVEDSGVYVCIMNNTAGAERIEVNLTVRSALDSHVEPTRQTVDLNHPALFRCTTTGYPQQRMFWLRNGQPLHLGHRYHTAPNGTLKIFNVQEGDEGSYQCGVENEYDMALASGALWLGDAMPVLLYKFSEQTLQPGPSVSLKCIAKGNPPPRIVWTLDGFPIPQNERYIVGQYVTIHDDVISHVNISHVESLDGGSYACIASNSVGSVTHSARLNVYGPPRIRQIPTVKAVEGRTVQVSCPVSGYPIDGIVWRKDGYELPSHGRQEVFSNGTLKIEGAHKLHDEGFYTCSAFNQRDESHSGTVQIEVLTPPTIMPFLFPNKLLNEGMRSAVSCQILEGSLPISFLWDKNGERIPSSSASSSNSMSNSLFGPTIMDQYQGVNVRSNDEYSSTLIIDTLEFGHRGNYTCTATNAAGSSFHTAELTVNVPPKWTEEPADTHAVVGQDILLPCSVEGFPEPSTVWTRANDFGVLNYQVLPLGLAYNQFSNGSLLISSVDKSTQGTYTCSAQNGVRSGISKTINVTVNAPPRFHEETVRLSVRKGDKASLICEASGDHPMDIFWRRNGLPITEHEDARFTIMEHLTGSESVSRFLIAPVLDQDGGQISCEAANRFGRDQKHFLLSIEDAPSSPGAVRLSAIKSRSLEISWSRPHDGNSPILNYIIEYSNIPDRRDQGERQRRKMTAPGDAVNLIVQNLRPGTRYKFRVSAENRHGVSPESQAVTTRMLEEAPTAQPKNLELSPKSSTQLEITWEAPPLPHWNSELLSYKIGYKEVGETTGFDYIDLHPSSELEHRFLLQPLKKFTSYQVIVQPYNKQGIGPASNAAVATTMEDVPSGPPENVHCQSRSPNSILLEWSKPHRDHRNGIIRGYWLQYYPRTLWYETSGRLQTKETEGEMLELDGLDTFTNYSIRVAAFTRAGKGKGSTQIFCRTSEDVPSSPADIKAVTSGDSSIIVSWRAPTLPNGIIQKYTVYRREIISGKEVDVKESSVLSGPNYLELSALKPNRRYDIWVKAETSAGYGASSDITSIILGRTVRARIVSFGEILAVPWKSNLVLDCLHVGEPRPSVHWQHRMRPIRENSKHQIFPNGSLSIQRLTESDQGDYTCSVHNVHGNDQILYEIIVQIPPSSPLLSVRNLTHTAIQLSWADSRSRKQPVLGYTLNFRREHGQWSTLDSDPLSSNFWLPDLDCGSNYSVYISAYNHVGPGHPSDTISAKTLGRVPDVPNPSELLKVNKTLVSVNLEAFGTGGCPILYFVLEYRRDVQPKYTMVSNNVSPLEKDYTIRGLDPAARYFIKVTAHNSAGSSVAEYPFATLTSFGATIPPPISTTARGSNNSYPFYIAIKVLATVFLSACLIVASFYVATFARKWKRKRDLELDCGHNHHMFLGSSSPVFESSRSAGGFRHSFAPKLRFHRRRRRTRSPPMLPPFKSSDTLCTAAGGSSFGPQDTWNKDICPYATFQLPRDQQDQQQQDQQQQVTIKLQHHAQLDEANNGTLCHTGHIFAPDGTYRSLQGGFVFAGHDDPLNSMSGMQNNTTDTFKIGRLRQMGASETERPKRKKTLTLHMPLAALSAAEVVDAKYDSDSDFDYRQKPPRPHYKRRKGRRRASHSSSSSDDADTLSPLPRVRSIEALEFPATIKAKHRPPNWRGQLRQQLLMHQQDQQQQLHQETNFIFGSGSILPPPRFSDHHNNHNSRRNNTSTFEMQPEVRTLGRPATKKIHHQIQV